MFRDALLQEQSSNKCGNFSLLYTIIGLHFGSTLTDARTLLGDRYVNFDKLNSIEKTAYVLGSKLWEYDVDNLLSLVKELCCRCLGCT